jgi:hypothetical protein
MDIAAGGVIGGHFGMGLLGAIAAAGMVVADVALAAASIPVPALIPFAVAATQATAATVPVLILQPL